MYHQKLFHVEIFRKKKVFGGRKAKYLFLEKINLDVETELRGLGDVGVRHRRSVSGAQGCSAPSLSHERS